MCVCVCVCMSVCVSVFMYVYVCVFGCVCMYVGVTNTISGTDEQRSGIEGCIEPLAGFVYL